MDRKWGLYPERGAWAIRRGAERLPIKQYRQIRNDEVACRALVDRLNAPLRIKEAVKYRHAFLNEELLDEYHEYLVAVIPTERSAHGEYRMLRKHCIDFFVSTLGLINPRDWKAVHETKWAMYLLSSEAPAARHSKKLIVYAANRFLGWLHERRPDELPRVRLAPLTKARLKKAEAEREGKKKRRPITDADWARIVRALPHSIRPYALLAYKFGLRRAEVLGLRVTDVRETALNVERQLLEGGVKTGPLKGREDYRQIPYWFGTAAYTNRLLGEAKPMRPDVLTHRWNRVMDRLGFTYDFHDIKHTFVSRALARGIHPREVQEAAAHRDITTTMRYAHTVKVADERIYRAA